MADERAERMRMAARVSSEGHQRTEQPFRELIEGFSQGVVVHRNFVPLFVNRAYAEIFGYATTEEVMALDSIKRLFPDAEHERLQTYHDSRLTEREAPTHYEMQGRRRDGGEIWLELRSIVIDWAGKPAVQTTISDISERKRSTAALERQRRFLEIAEPAANVGLWSTDLRTGEMYWSEGLFRIFAYDPVRDAPSLSGFLERIHPEDRARVERERLKRLKSGRDYDIEYRIVLPDGCIRWIASRGEIIRDQGGRGEQATGMVVDTTELKTAQAISADNERRLEEAQRLANLGSWEHLVDDGRNRLFWSDQVYRIFGIEKTGDGEAPRNAFWDAMHPDDREKVERAFRQAVETDGTYRIDHRIVRPDGEIRVVREQAKVELDEGRNVRRVVGTVQDITDIHRAEEALAESEARYRAIVETALAGVIVYDRNYRPLFINQTLARLFGFETAEEFLQLDDMSHLIAPHEIGRLRDWRRKRLAGEDVPSLYEFEGVRRDGSPIWILAHTQVIEWDGKPAIMSTNIDITERRELESRLRESQKMEALGQLTGGVAHEFNNLLQIIQGNLELIQEISGHDGELAPRIEAGIRGTTRASELTDRLLSFSRRQPLSPKTVELTPLLLGMRGMLDAALPETIALEVDIPAALWATEVDPGQLENAVLNLCLNARDALRHGGAISISGRNAVVEEDMDDVPDGLVAGDYVVIGIRDNGTGMDDATRTRAFEPFFTTKEVGRGTGLGLSMVYGFAQQSGGSATIESAPGRGTTVNLYLPRSRRDADAEAGANAGARNEAPNVKKTILVVEDDTDVRDLLVNLLLSFGYRVIEATDGPAALEAIMNQPAIDLLFTDVVLPGGMDGMRLAGDSRAVRPDLKVVYTTGYADDIVAASNELAGNDIVLRKPYGKRVLAEALSAIFTD